MIFVFRRRRSGRCLRGENENRTPIFVRDAPSPRNESRINESGDRQARVKHVKPFKHEVTRRCDREAREHVNAAFPRALARVPGIWLIGNRTKARDLPVFGRPAENNSPWPRSERNKNRTRHTASKIESSIRFSPYDGSTNLSRFRGTGILDSRSIFFRAESVPY